MYNNRYNVELFEFKLNYLIYKMFELRKGIHYVFYYLAQFFNMKAFIKDLICLINIVN